MTDYIPEETLNEVIRLMRPENKKALKMELRHGMRIGDVLTQKWENGWEEVRKGRAKTVTYQEQKTKKQRTIYPSQEEAQALYEMRREGNPYIFPGRGRDGHRTRQAVWKDLHEIAALYRVNGRKLVRKIGTHSARKVYAVRQYTEALVRGESEPMKVVMEDLNHSDLSVTFVYALADVISKARYGEKM